MSTETVSIRELRTDFRSVKRKIEEHGQVIVTDNGVPSYELKPVTPPRRAKTKNTRTPDYYSRLLKRQPKPMSERSTREFWEYERGDR
jgi:antitoxin (DNA-binding transcriptional repressor) of toxin-antitoxin stability system